MTLTEDQPRHAKQLKRAMILTRGQISNRQRERPTAIMGAGLGKDVAFHVVGDVDASGSNTPWDELEFLAQAGYGTTFLNTDQDYIVWIQNVLALGGEMEYLYHFNATFTYLPLNKHFPLVPSTKRSAETIPGSRPDRRKTSVAA
ncbi:uncharacterized protein PV07_08737 [Cladophialophora immunda]|uniref:Uncharacterized protein n=1 Tax=Cladophialophora immunda TaxID=569365 RepID=A0A0D1ZCW0_9EURO|nr:uncharacterized protein PV07_08737 [Cladophialophora immunda]KIW25571.1 hypothetical protein PV07_08737 [Cladophialophora immunda]